MLPQALGTKSFQASILVLILGRSLRGMYLYPRVRQVYADFYKLAVDLDPEVLCMVFPLGWQKPNNHNGLGQIKSIQD